jgi:hypothetical protein
MNEWIDWLKDTLAEYRKNLAEGQTKHPAIQPEGANLHTHDHGHSHSHHHSHTHDHTHSQHTHSHES